MCFRRIDSLALVALLAASCSEPGAVRPQLLGTARDCDAAVYSCTVGQSDTAVTLALGQPVVPLKPFAVTLHIAGMQVEPQSVVIDFQMEGMDMGSNRYRLSADAGEWRGIVTLPVCTSSRMDWVAEVQFVAAGRAFLARFPFSSEAN